MKLGIEFRGLTPEDKWVYGYLIKQGAYYFIQNKKGGNIGVREDTVGQYLNLKDSDGVKVYHGDLLDFDEKEWGSKFNPEPIYMEDIIGEWALSGSLNDLKKWRKVVGNVYQN